MHKIPDDITEMAAQIPAWFETLSGMPLNELFANVRMIGDKTTNPEEKSKAARSNKHAGESLWHFWRESQRWSEQTSTTADKHPDIRLHIEFRPWTNSFNSIPSGRSTGPTPV